MATLFHDATARQIIDAVRNLQSQYTNIQSNLAMQGLRRHEVRDGKDGHKLVKYDWLPGAFGGPYGRYPTSSEGIANGNYDATSGTGTDYVRKYYQRACYEWGFEVDDSVGNVHAEDVTTDFLYVANPFDLPLIRGMGLAMPMEGGWYLLTQPLCPNPWGAMHFVFEPSTTEYQIAHEEHILLQGNVTSPSDYFEETTNWCFAVGRDIFLACPGTYKITMGCQAGMGSTELYQDITTSNPDVPPNHTHTFRSYSKNSVWLRLYKNFEPGDAIDATSTGLTLRDEQLVVHLLPSSPNSQNGTNLLGVGEKTFTISSDSTAWHGQPYTRLSIAASAVLDTNAVGFDSVNTKAAIGKVWIIIEPQTDEPGFMGGGAQQWPTGYNKSVDYSTIFKWYGGGDVPAVLAEDGTEVP